MRGVPLNTLPAAEAAHPSRDGWTLVTVLGVGSFAIGTDLFVTAGILAGLANDLGVTVGAAGLVVTLFALAYAVGAPLLNALFGARPFRQVLIGALVAFALFNALSAAAPTFPALLAVRVLSALAASVYVPSAAASAVAAVPPSHRGRALSVILGGASVATVLGAPLGVTLATLLSWRAAFGLVAALAGGTVLGLLLVAPRSPRPVRSTLGERLRPMRSASVVGTLGVTFLVMAGSNSLYTYLAVLLGSTAAPVELGLFIGAFGLGGLLGTWRGGSAADQGGGQWVAFVAVTALIATVAAFPFVATTVAGALAIALLWGIAAWAFVPAQQHRLIGLRAGPAPLVLALNTSTTHLGFAAGALLGGLVIDSAGVGSLFLLAVACCLVGLLLHVTLNWETKS